MPLAVLSTWPKYKEALRYEKPRGPVIWVKLHGAPSSKSKGNAAKAKAAKAKAMNKGQQPATS